MPRKRGRPPLSTTGERRAEWRIAIAPMARAKAEKAAMEAALSPSAWIEALILAQPP